MPHSIYTGSFESLELRWMDTISDLQREDPLLEIGVLVGSNILASYLKRCLAENGRTAANIRFYTFLDLASRLATLSGEAVEKPHLPQPGPAIILENLLAENTPSVYRSLSGYRGFRDALLETFRDLRDAGVSPDELDLAIQKGASMDRRPHLSGFADLYRGYRERIRVFHDVDEDFRAAIRNAAEKKEALGVRQLLVYGIYDVTGQQSRLLAALKDSLDMIYFIPFVDDAVSDFARPFLDRRAIEIGVSPIRLQSEPPVNSLEFLAACNFGFSSERDKYERTALESHLHGSEEPSAHLPDDGSFSLISVPGESRTAVEIIREIFRAVHDGTIRGFHEAAVVLRQPETDVPILTEMLRLRGVPHFVHGGNSFAERSFSRAVIALTKIANPFSRESILAAMELVVAALPGDTVSKWDIQGWRALTNDPRFLAGLGSWDAGTEALIAKAQADLERAEAHPIEAAETGIRSVPMARGRLETALLLRDSWKLLKQAAADWPEFMSWRDWATFVEQRFEPLLGDSEDWHLFSSVLDELGNLETLNQFEIGDRVSAEKLKSAMVEALSSRSYPVGRFQRSGVNILSTSAARGLRFPLVIIPGLDEGRFPAKLRQDPLLLDAERSLMKTLPLKSKRIDEEKLLFNMAARSAKKRLVLMTSRLDEGSDRERIPSQFFMRVASAVCGRAITMRDLTGEAIAGFRSVSLDNPAPAARDFPVDEGEIRLRIVTAERKSARSALRVLAQLEPLRLDRPLKFDESRFLRKLTSFDGRLTDPSLVRWTAQKIGPSAGQVSASRIEEYVKCPYSFFLKRVMDLQAWEEQATIEGMDPLDRGLVVHSMLEKFFTDDALFQSSSEKLHHELESLARASLDAARPAGLADLLWEIERDALIKMLSVWLEFERGRAGSGMHVARLEKIFGEFGPEEKFPAFRLNAGRHGFDFRGRIDRIDLSGDRKRARVVDYKTGALPDSMANKNRTPLMSGERIQIVIYTGALSVLDEFKGVETIEGEYLHLQPKNSLTVSCPFTHDELQSSAKALTDILEIVGDGIESGVFFARTSGKIRPMGHCDYCDYLPVCGKDRIQREERKSQDPDVQRFLEVVGPL